MHIELWQVHSYQNNIVEYFPIQTNDTKTPMKILGSKGRILDKITREIKTYDEEYHFQRHRSDKIKELYYEIKSRIISLGDNIEPMFRKDYIVFKTNYNFVYLYLKRNMIHINLALKINEVQDPKKILRDMGVGHHGPGHSRIIVNEKSQIPYMMGLVEQSYTKSIKKQIP